MAFKPNFKALSLFRIAISIYLLVEFLSFSNCCFQDFYGKTGLKGVTFSTSAIDSDVVVRLLLAFMEFIRLPAVFPFLYPLAIVAFGVGYRTRWSNAVVLVLHIYFTARTPIIIYGADILAHLMLLWCLFLPMSRYWAIDAALDTAAKDHPYPRLPFAAIMLQASSIYVFPALIKLAGAPWRDGYAVIWALSDNMFGGTPVGSWLVNTVPDLLIYANYLVIAFQLAFPLLVFFPWRNDLMRAIALLGAAAIQVSFIFCLDIGAFPYISLAILLLYVPDAWLDRLSSSRRSRPQCLSIYYEPDCSFCRKIALLFREFLLDPAVPVLPASADPEMLRLLKLNQTWIVRADNVNYLKWHGVAYLLKQRRLFAPLAWLMETGILVGPMQRLYDFIGRTRRPLSAISKTLLPFRDQGGIGRAGIAFCGLLAALAFCSNVISIVTLGDQDAPRKSYLDTINNLARFLQVSQHWFLFAPVPTHFQRKFEITVRYIDGSARELADILPRPPFRARPDGTGFDFAHHRWLKYFSAAQDFSDREWQALGAHLCRQIREQSMHPTGAPHAIEISLSTKSLGRAVAGGLVTVSRRSIDCAA